MKIRTSGSCLGFRPKSLVLVIGYWLSVKNVLFSLEFVLGINENSINGNSLLQQAADNRFDDIVKLLIA